jgi:ankyrin repeat protein
MNTHEHSAAWQRYKNTMRAEPTLSGAARSNDVGELARLLDAGGELEARDARGYSALMLAAYSGQLEATQYLLARGGSPNTSDAAGNSALMGAAFKGELAIVRALLAAGADLGARNDAGLDAKGFALHFGRHEVLAFFAAEPTGRTQSTTTQEKP